MRLHAAAAPDPARDELFEALLDEADAFARAYTGLAVLPASLDGAVTRLALTFYSELGLEGVSDATDGGSRRRMDGVPDTVKRELDAHRRAMVVRVL